MLGEQAKGFVGTVGEGRKAEKLIVCWRAASSETTCLPDGEGACCGAALGTAGPVEFHMLAVVPKSPLGASWS